MPELPEIETIKRDLQKKILNKTITRVKVWDARVIRNCTQAQFIRSLKNQKIKNIVRIGKAVIWQFESGLYLTIQPMMSGQLVDQKSKSKSTKLTFQFSDEECLHYNDHRLFGRLNIVKDLNKIQYFRSIGPDPFSSDFQIESLAEKLSQRKMPIKPLLMDQHFVAGIGNIYASEILFRSRISPLRSANSLKKKEIRRLHKTTIEILKEAVRLRGSSMNTYRDVNNEKGKFMDYVKVYGRDQQQCSRCRKPIERIVQAGRSTFFCRGCQS